MITVPTTTWKVTCRSAQDARELQDWVSNRVKLDRVLTDTIRTTSNGVEQTEDVHHRLGDYFADIRVLSDADVLAFRLAFERKPDAARYWKDLMVSIIQEIKGNPQAVEITVDSSAAFSAKAS
jgi:hypothetical protein